MITDVLNWHKLSWRLRYNWWELAQKTAHFGMLSKKEVYEKCTVHQLPTSVPALRSHFAVTARYTECIPFQRACLTSAPFIRFYHIRRKAGGVASQYCAASIDHRASARFFVRAW
eukprot:IDg2240t1